MSSLDHPPVVIWECSKCGFKTKIYEHQKDKVQHNCTKKPSLVRRAVNYANAVARWKAAGSPVRNKDEITKLLEICKKCRFYREGVCEHKRCGCRVNSNKTPLTNKLKMATESCPINKWG